MIKKLFKSFPKNALKALQTNFAKAFQNMFVKAFAPVSKYSKKYEKITNFRKKL